MFPDRWGSDYDYDADHGNWSLDEARVDWCEDHEQRASTCGPCHAAGRLPDNDENEGKDVDCVEC